MLSLLYFSCMFCVLIACVATTRHQGEHVRVTNWVIILLFVCFIVFLYRDVHEGPDFILLVYSDWI